MSEPLDDLAWLVGPEAGARLRELASLDADPLRAARRLRAELSPERARLVAEQLDLRRRAHEKFSRAQEMFFTRRALEQASDEHVARYKAGRFPRDAQVADLCAGIGGDAWALAERGPVIAVDRDPAVATLLRANLALLSGASCDVRSLDVAEFDPGEVSAWHIDPDRRPGGKRSVQPELHEPSVDAIDRLLERQSNAAIKLAPAAEVPPSWRGSCEQEWISRSGECRQLVAWFGKLASVPGQRRATLVAPGGAVRTLFGRGDRQPPIAAEIGAYLYEPDAAVLASRLTAELAEEHSLASVAAGVGYLTGDRLCHDPALAAFAVTDVLPYHERTLQRLFAERGCGRLEVKKRGVSHDPNALQRRLRGQGDGSATLILTRRGEQALAIVARRL